MCRRLFLVIISGTLVACVSATNNALLLVVFTRRLHCDRSAMIYLAALAALDLCVAMKVSNE